MALASGEALGMDLRPVEIEALGGATNVSPALLPLLRFASVNGVAPPAPRALSVYPVCGAPSMTKVMWASVLTMSTPPPYVIRFDARGLLRVPAAFAKVDWIMSRPRPAQSVDCTTGSFRYSPLQRTLTLNPQPQLTPWRGWFILEAQLVRLGKVLSATGATKDNPSLVVEWGFPLR